MRSLSSLPLLGLVLVLAADRWLLAATTVGLGGVILLHDPHPDGHAVAVRFVLVFLGLFLTLMTVLTAMDVVVRVLLDTPITPHGPFVVVAERGLEVICLGGIVMLVAQRPRRPRRAIDAW